VAIADYVLHTEEHPSADVVWKKVSKRFPTLSRGTVYNTLNLFVEKGLLQALALSDDRTVFDPNTGRHHHLIDEESGAIYDIPWNEVKVQNVRSVHGYQIHDYQVVMRGSRKRRRTA
jgi:Fe2+ or Zn2+ uptake regulation protein